MKKIALILLSFVACLSAYAFDFDGINLNGSVSEITRAVSKKNYVATAENPNMLTGLCHGTKVNLTFNYTDVTETGRLGQLIVEIPNTADCAYVDNAQLLNIIYHQVKSTETGYLYQVDKDGTTLLLSKIPGGIRLTYSTPYYKVKK